MTRCFMKPLRLSPFVVAASVVVALTFSGLAAAATIGSQLNPNTTSSQLYSGSDPNLSVMPMTSGLHCSGQSCINVVGTKLHVNNVEYNGYSLALNGTTWVQIWDTSGYLFYWSSPLFWDESTLPPHIIVGNLVVNLNLPNNDQVCLKFLGTGHPSGNPCVTIHN